MHKHTDPLYRYWHSASGGRRLLRMGWKWIRRLLVGAVGLVPAVIFTAASVGPQDAGSNLAKWFEWSGIPQLIGHTQLPTWLTDKSADQGGKWIGALLFVGFLVVEVGVPLWHRRNRSRVVPINPLGSTNTSWLRPAEVLAGSAVPALKNRRDAAYSTMLDTSEQQGKVRAQIVALSTAQTGDTKERSAAIGKLTKQLRILQDEHMDAGDEVNKLDAAIIKDVYDRLASGALLAKGIVAPVTKDSREILIPPEWWRFLRIDPNTSEAGGNDVKIVGLLIGKPVTDPPA